MRLGDPSGSTRQRPICWFQGLKRLLKHSHQSGHSHGKASLHSTLLCWTLIYDSWLPDMPSRPWQQSLCRLVWEMYTKKHCGLTSSHDTCRISTCKTQSTRPELHCALNHSSPNRLAKDAEKLSNTPRSNMQTTAHLRTGLTRPLQAQIDHQRLRHKSLLRAEGSDSYQARPPIRMIQHCWGP